MPEQPVPEQPELFPVRYAVHGGHPRVDLELEVAADGSCDVHVLTGWFPPQEPGPLRLGRFAGTLDQRTTSALAALVTGAGAEAPTGADTGPHGAQDGGPPPPGAVARLVAAASEALHAVPGPAPELDDAMVATATAALAHPVAGVEVTAGRAGHGTPDHAGAFLRLTGLGTAPFPLLLSAPEPPGYWVRVWRDDPGEPGGRVHLPAADVTALVAAGSIPSGVRELAPGSSVYVPLPGVDDDPTGAWTGGFVCWRAGTGPERRQVTGAWALPGSASTSSSAPLL